MILIVSSCTVDDVLHVTINVTVYVLGWFTWFVDFWYLLVCCVYLAVRWLFYFIIDCCLCCLYFKFSWIMVFIVVFSVLLQRGLFDLFEFGFCDSLLTGVCLFVVNWGCLFTGLCGCWLLGLGACLCVLWCWFGLLVVFCVGLLVLDFCWLLTFDCECVIVVSY